jgi:Xaa-Pro aminopeptidase
MHTQTTHEEPRIVPGSERVLEAGMVVALEPEPTATTGAFASSRSSS